MRVVLVLAAVVSITGCGIVGGPSEGQKLWDAASDTEREEWCSALNDVGTFNVLLGPILQADLSEGEAEEFMRVLAQNCV